MDFSFTEEQTLLRSEAQGFLSSEWPSATLRRMLEDPEPAREQIWRKIAQLGWPGLLVAEDHQGLGLGMYDLTVLMEEMGRRLMPGTFFSTGVLATLALDRLGSEAGRQKYLPGIAEGRLKATVALHEPGAGWDVSVLRIHEGGETCVKSPAPEAASADVVLCAVREPERMLLVVPRDPDITAMETLDPTRSLGEIRFDPAQAETVGEGSLEDIQSVIDLATVALAAEMLGVTAELLDATVAYVKSRKQFGRPVGSFQAVQHRAADWLIELEKARSAAYYAAMVADEAPEGLALAASMAKVAANQACRFAAQQAIQLHGGIGFAWEQDLHLYFKRAKSAEFTFGSTPWHLERIACKLGL